MSAFHADERRDLALLEDALDVVHGECQLERLRVLAHHAVHDVDLLERRRHGRRIICRDVDRPELSADTACPEPRDVGHDRRLGPGDVELVQIAPGILSERPGVIVVPVDERHLPVQLPRARKERRVVLGRLGDCGNGKDEKTKCDKNGPHNRRLWHAGGAGQRSRRSGLGARGSGLEKH
jgi:hypothetical protein